MKISKKSKLFSILFVSVLIISGISLTLVQGDKPEDAGTPPSGLLADLIIRVDNIQNELVNIQNELSSIHSDIGSLGDEVEWQVADIRDLIAFIDTDIRSDITLLNEAINNVNDGLQNQIDDLNTRTPQTGVISIPAAAFTSISNPPEGPYYNDGAVMYNMHLGGQSFVAPVCLPNGVEIKGLTMKTTHGNELMDGVRGLLVRSNPPDINGEGLVLARIYSNNSISGFGKFYGYFEFSGTYLHVDNSIYSYFFNIILPANEDANFCFVTLEYEYPE